MISGPLSYQVFRETGPWCHMWFEFVLDFHLAWLLFSGFSSFPPPTKKTNIFKFIQFDLEDMHENQLKSMRLPLNISVNAVVVLEM